MDVVYLYSSILGKHNLLEDGWLIIYLGIMRWHLCLDFCED